MDRAGLVGDDGPTHHGAFDIAYLRCLPNIVLMAPRDEAMLVHMLHTALATTRARSRCATRAAGGSAWRFPPPGASWRSGPARSCARAAGDGHPRRAARIRHRRRQGARGGRHPRRHGISATVADARFAKPIDAGLAAQLAAEHELLVTVEEGVLAEASAQPCGRR